MNWKEEFAYKFIGVNGLEGVVPGILEDFISNLLQRQKEEIVEQVKKLYPERPTNSLMDIAYAMRKEETLSEKEKEHIKNRDNGMYIKMVAFAAKEELLVDVLNLISHKGGEDK